MCTCHVDIQRVIHHRKRNNDCQLTTVIRMVIATLHQCVVISTALRLFCSISSVSIVIEIVQSDMVVM